MLLLQNFQVEPKLGNWIRRRMQQKCVEKKFWIQRTNGKKSNSQTDNFIDPCHFKNRVSLCSCCVNGISGHYRVESLTGTKQGTKMHFEYPLHYELYWYYKIKINGTLDNGNDKDIAACNGPSIFLLSIFNLMLFLLCLRVLFSSLLYFFFVLLLYNHFDVALYMHWHFEQIKKGSINSVHLAIENLTSRMLRLSIVHSLLIYHSIFSWWTFVSVFFSVCIFLEFSFSGSPSVFHLFIRYIFYSFELYCWCMYQCVSVYEYVFVWVFVCQINRFFFCEWVLHFFFCC